MTMKTKLLAASAALLLSTGAALAVPATAETDLNVRSGPGTQHPVIGTLAGGETVDVGSCSGSWCQVRFGGGTGFASQNYLAIGGGAGPGPAVAVAPGYVYDYDDDYYGYGGGYGPSVGFGIYASPGHRFGGWRGHRGWRGDRVGTSQGRPGWDRNRGNWQGGNRQGGNWQGRGGSPRVGSAGGVRGGGMTAAPGSASPQVSAPAGMSGGGGAAAGAGAAAGGVAAGGAVGRGQVR